jgi:hypothetical protein
MRQRGFKRPGGGWTFTREQPIAVPAPQTHRLCVSTIWPRGEWWQLRLTLHQALRGSVELRTRQHQLPLDVDGDVGDLAVSIHHWLRAEGLPWFEAPIDFEALARDAEQRLGAWSSGFAVSHCVTLWELAGSPNDAARVRMTGDQLAPCRLKGQVQSVPPDGATRLPLHSTPS